MSIEYNNQPLFVSESKDSYTCLFPSIGIKKCGTYEHFLSEIYAKYPQCDYYKEYSSSGNRATPGTFQKYQDPGVFNMYIKVYPGTKAYPNDNSYLRIKNFGNIFKELATQCQGIRELHLEIPSKVQSEQQEYVQHLQDFLGTVNLHGQDIKIIIHGNSEPVKLSDNNTKPEPTIMPQRTEKRFKLEFKPEQLNNVVFYEVDFLNCDQSSVMDSSDLGVLSLFPEGWSELIEDTRLIQEAQKVQSNLGDLIGTPEVFPPREDIFNAFSYLTTTPKAVIIGQDPYHGKGQAHGLSFSVHKGVTVPPSLRNIYSALENDQDIEFTRPGHGFLKRWAEQGVIMLNAALTVEKAKPKSHSAHWLPFTDRLITLLSQKYPQLIFVLWGTDAKKKKELIEGSHLVLEYNHPSPMVRNNDFSTNCKHFSDINRYLAGKGQPPIDWNLD